jgi:AmiR/NasT family two-component response regulator
VTENHSAVDSETRPVRVLLAEDEAIIRLDLREILESEGYEVVGETGRGDQAVELASKLHPEIAILDIKMPGMDGIEAAKLISRQGDVACLILTAFSQRDLVEQARDAGALAYLVKPFQREELMPAIEMALARFTDLSVLKDQNEELRQRAQQAEEGLETRKLVDRAKAILMEKRSMKESEAFAYIQRHAMDTRRRMRDVAEEIIASN